MPGENAISPINWNNDLRNQWPEPGSLRMIHLSSFWLSLSLGLGAGLADYLGGFLLVRRSPSAKSLRYFVALGAGFMLGAALLEMVPEGMAINPHWAPLLILTGYCGVHLLEHTLVPHFHFGEETHQHNHDAHIHARIS